MLLLSLQLAANWTAAMHSAFWHTCGLTAHCILVVLQARNGEPDNTPEEIMNMVKQKAAPPHRCAKHMPTSQRPAVPCCV
jgi:hypothetical protein